LFYLYYHGVIENYCKEDSESTPQDVHYTGYAFSEDGINFITPELNIIDLGEPFIAPKDNLDPYGRTITVSTLRPDASYLRIFKLGDYLYGIYKSWAKTYLARSMDGINWESWPHNPLIQIKEGEEFSLIRHTGVLVYENFADIYYSTFEDENENKEVIKLARLKTEGDWENWSIIKVGKVLDATDAWENNNLRDPFPFRHDDKIYLFYSGGLEKAIGLAIADDAVFECLNTSKPCKLIQENIRN